MFEDNEIEMAARAVFPTLVNRFSEDSTSIISNLSMFYVSESSSFTVRFLAGHTFYDGRVVLRDESVHGLDTELHAWLKHEYDISYWEVEG